MKRLLLFTVVLFAATLWWRSAEAEPWSEKLGFPPGRKVLILNAREMGVTWEINEAGKELLQQGHISSLDVVVTAPWFDSFAQWSRTQSETDIGISIALTNPYTAIQWRLLTSEIGPTTLVDAAGFPWKTVVQFAVSASPDDVKRELDAQISRAQAAGVPLSHISGYYGTVLSRADLTAIVLGAAKKYWLPAPVVDLTPELIEQFRAEGYPVDETIVTLLQDYPLPKLDDLQIVPLAASLEEKRDNFIRLLQELPPGLTQIVCRPAMESLGMKMLAEDWQQRVWTAQVLSDPEVQQALQQERIIITNWREVMQRFEGVAPRSEGAPTTSEPGETGGE